MATVMYDSASFVDISQIQQKIANSTQSSVIGVTMRESNAEVLSLNVMRLALVTGQATGPDSNVRLFRSRRPCTGRRIGSYSGC